MIGRVYYEGGVSDESLEAVTTGLQFVSLVVPGVEGIQPKPEMIGKNVLPTLASGQVDVACLSDLEPWAGKELQAVVTARDLGARSLNYCFGNAHQARGLLVVSTARLSDDPVALVGLTVHETGHAFGLVREEAVNYDTVSSFPGHCINDCVMQAVNDIADMKRVSEQLAVSVATAGFCGNCALELSKVHFA